MNDDENTLHVLIQEYDGFFLDRGFGDGLEFIKACGYGWFVPPSKDRGETQLATELASKAQAITVCRWVVEVVNSRLKRDLKLLRQKYFDKALPYVLSTRTSEGGLYALENRELTGVIRDYLQTLLLLRPQNAMDFTREYFGATLQDLDLPHNEFFNPTHRNVRYYFYED